MMATRKGLVKKTPLEQYSRPKKGGIIAISFVRTTKWSTSCSPSLAMRFCSPPAVAWRFASRKGTRAADGCNTSGVKGVSLKKTDELVGMVVADPDATLLTVCENGYGKRTPFGPNAELVEEEAPGGEIADEELPRCSR